MTDKAKFLGRTIYPKDLVKGLKTGEVRHGLSNGSWSLVTLLYVLAQECGPKSSLDLAVWTASGADASLLIKLFKLKKLKEIRMCVDRSFKTRQPQACDVLIDCFGIEALRVWSCHAKFAVFYGGVLDVLVMFSANLNKNRRIENFTVWADRRMCKEYIDMIDQLWSTQNPNEGFTDSKSGRRATAKIQNSGYKDTQSDKIGALYGDINQSSAKSNDLDASGYLEITDFKL